MSLFLNDGSVDGGDRVLRVVVGKRTQHKSCIWRGHQSWVQYLLRSFGAAYSFYHALIKYEKTMIKG